MAGLIELAAKVADEDPKTLDESSRLDSMGGWDSFMSLTIVGEVEKAYGVKFTAEETMRFVTLGDIRAALIAKGISDSQTRSSP